MTNKLLALIAAVAITLISGCVAYPVNYDGTYAIGFYDPAFGYWTGYGWDPYYYNYGHRGWGHPHYYGPRRYR